MDGAETLVGALRSMQTDTRRFARRQRTWLRAIPDVHWHDPGDAPAIFDRVDAFLTTGESRQGESVDADPQPAG